MTLTSQTLRRQAAEALRTGNYALMHTLNQQADQRASEERLDVFAQAQRKIAKDTLRMPEAVAAMVGTPHAAARRILKVTRR
jgi:hypothetical protein